MRTEHFGRCPRTSFPAAFRISWPAAHRQSCSLPLPDQSRCRRLLPAQSSVRVSWFASQAFTTTVFICTFYSPRNFPTKYLWVIESTKDTILLTGSCDRAAIQLVELRPEQGAHPTNFNAALATVATPSKFVVQVARFDGPRDRLFSSFLALREDAGGGQTVLGTNRFVEDLSGVSTWTHPFPEAASKKGLQVQMVDDALALGIKHAALNINFSQMIDPGGSSNNPAWLVDGQTIRFQRGYIESLDRQIRPLTDAGVTVSLILLAYQSGDPALNLILLRPGYDKAAPNHLGAFNTVTPEGVLHFRACVEFLAHRFGDPGV